MAKQEYPHPQDEFDVLGVDRAPQGVHRRPIPRWRLILPFVVVLILGPTLAYLGVSYLSGLGSDDGTTPPAVSAAPVATPDETPEPEPEPEPQPEPEPEPEPTPELDVRRETPLFVLNGAGVSGLAGTAAAALTGDGFTNVTASNYNRAQPTASTVYYNNAELADTARQVGQVLGVGPVVELASATSTIAVVLRGDFTP